MRRRTATTRRAAFIAATLSASIALMPVIARGASVHIDDARLPDPIRSPGEAREDVKIHDLCDAHAAAGDAKPSAALCEGAFAAYRIAEPYRYQYECAFVLPPTIGGTPTSKNVWPQPAEEAPLKHAVETELRDRMCQGTMTPAQAQRDLVLDWTSAYRRYVVHDDMNIVRDVAVASPAPRDTTVGASQQNLAARHTMQAGSGDMPQADSGFSQPIEANIAPNINRTTSQNAAGGASTRGRQANNRPDRNRTTTGSNSTPRRAPEARRR